MSKIPDNHQFAQLLAEGNIPALLTEAYQLLVMYITGDDLDLEPLLSAQFLLQHTLTCLSDNKQKEAVDKSEESKPDWQQGFPISFVTREDIVSAGFKHEVVEKLTNKDLQEIASAMEDSYCDHGYWEDLTLCTKRVLEQKNADAGLYEDRQTEGSEE